MAQLLVEYFSIFGIPQVILTDRGRSFECELLFRLCELLGIKKVRTGAYVPWGDGRVERAYRWLGDALATLPERFQNDWDLHCGWVCFCYNNSVHASLQVCPNEMVFGRVLRDPLASVIHPLDTASHTENATSGVLDFVQIQKKSIQDIQRFARECADKNFDQRKKLYDKNCQPPFRFETGARVAKLVEKVHRRGKLANRFDGPWVVTKVHGPNNVSITNGWTVDKVNTAKLVPWVERPDTLETLSLDVLFSEQDLTPVTPNYDDLQITPNDDDLNITPNDDGSSNDDEFTNDDEHIRQSVSVLPRRYPDRQRRRPKHFDDFVSD